MSDILYRTCSIFPKRRVLTVFTVLGLFFGWWVLVVSAQDIVISGTVYDTDRSTLVSTQPTLRLAINGTVVATTSAATDGTYSFAAATFTGSGESFTVYIDDPTEVGATVSRSGSATTISGFDLYLDHLAVRHEDGGPLTNTDLAHYDETDDAAVPYAVGAGTVTLSADTTLYVPSGQTYDPGGNVDTPELEVDGTFTAGSKQITVRDSGVPFRVADSATFTAGSSTIRYTGTASTTVAAVSYYNLETAPASGTPTYTVTGDTLAVPVTNQLVLHLDASQLSGLSNNDSIATWTDESTSGNDLTQGTANNQPLYQTNVLNGLPAVRFDGNQWLRNNAIYSQPGHLFTVFQQDGGSASKNLEILFDGRAGEQAGNIIFMELWNSSSLWRMYTSGSFTFSSPGTAADNFGILTTLYDTSNSVARFNGTQLGTGDVGAGELRGLTLGADRNDGRGFNGHIAELLWYDASLNGTEQTAVEQYLDEKWLGSGGESIEVQNDIRLVDDGGAATFDLAANEIALSVGGDITIETDQTFLAASTTLSVDGDFTNNGTFTANDGTVVLDGVDQTIAGSSTFYNLTKNVTSSSTLTFAAGATTTISNDWDFSGTAGNVLQLRSSVPGEQWYVDPQGTRTLAHVDVADANNINASSIDATSATIVNSGNNTNWTFGSGSISGTIYESDRTTPSDVGAMVTLAVDGVVVATSTAATSTGQYSFSGLTSITVGTPVSVYYDTGTVAGAIITKHPGTNNLDELDLYDTYVLAQHDDSGPLRTSDIAHFDDSDDVAVPYSVSGGALTVADSFTFAVQESSTFVPNGDTSFDRLELFGTFTAGSYTHTIRAAGTPFALFATGAFQADTSTVVYEGVTNTSILPTEYYNVETNPASGNPNYFFREGATLPIQNSLVLHLDATAITGVSDGAAVSQWQDLSGFGNDAETWSGVPNPTFQLNQINGEPVVRYTGTEGLLVPHDPSLSTGDVFTIFAVVDLAATTTDVDNIRTIVSKENNYDDRNYWLVHWDGEWRGRVSDGGTAQTVTSDANSATEPVSISYQANGTDLRMWVDNVEQSTVTPYGTIDNQNSPLGIGRQADDQRSWDGDIGEILIFDTDLTSTDRSAVEDYLNLKWFGQSTGGSQTVTIANDLILRDGGGNAVLDFAAEDDQVQVAGDIRIETDQTLEAPSTASFTVGGDFENLGTFNANGGTVTFSGSDQSVIGSTIFHNFTKTATTTDTFTFAADTTTVVTNTWTMQGDVGAELQLRSSTPGSTWSINPQGVRNLQYLDVQDSLNVNASTLDATDGTFVDSGNNANWLFEIITDYRIQRGSITLTSTSTSLTSGTDYAALENPDQAFLRITNTSHTGAGASAGGGIQAPGAVTALVDGTGLGSGATFTRATATADTRVDWEIIEYVGIDGGDNQMRVRDVGSVSFAGGVATATGTTVSGVSDDADIAVFVTGYQNPASDPAEHASGLATAAWDTGTQRPVFTRGSTATGQVEVSYAVVEFVGSNWKVQRAEHQYSTAGVTETENITSVNSLSRTFLHAQKRAEGGPTGVNAYGHEVWLSSIGAVSFQLDGAVATPADHHSVAWIIENTQTGDGAMSVYRSNGTLPDDTTVQPQVTTVPIGATVTLSEASLFSTLRATGTTAAFPQPVVGASLISDTQYQLWSSDGGGVQTFRSEVVTWPTAQPALFQDSYRFYSDNDAVTPSDPYPPGATDLGENMSITSSDQPPGEGDQLRIRMSVRVEDATLPADTQAFKLQYGKRTTSCTDVSFWTDVGSPAATTEWRGVDGAPTSGVSLGSDPPLAAELLLASTDRAGTYQESNPTPANPQTVNTGEAVEYDWHIEHNGAEQNSEYCFRMIKSDGTTFSDYDVYPTVRTAAFAPQVTNWRWYDDPQNETPSSPRAGETVTPSDVVNSETLTLRVQLAELLGATDENVKFALQFSQYSDFKDGGTILRPFGSCTANDLWCYADGAGTDNATITTAVLSGTDSCAAGSGSGCGTYNETATTTSNFSHSARATTEYEFTLQHAGARANAVYYFRLYDTVNDVPVTASSSNPSIATEGAQLEFTTNGLPSGTTTAGVSTDISTSPTGVNFTGLTPGQSSFAAHRLEVSTNATEGYQVFLATDQQLTNVYGDTVPPISSTNELPSGWASACDLQTYTGCFGYHTTDATLEGGSTRFSALDSYAPLEVTPREVMYSPVPTTDIHDILYRIEVGVEQPAGEYSANMQFIAIPVF